MFNLSWTQHSGHYSGFKPCQITTRRMKGLTKRREINIKFLPNSYGLLTMREVKMAGYWPSSVFACYGPRRSRGP